MSIAHVPVELRDDLASHESVFAYRCPYGWLMWVPDDVDDSALWGPPLPEAVLAVQRYARGLGCDWVLLDIDGDGDPSLPSYGESGPAETPSR